MRACREQGFPVTIVRPSLTYGPSQIPPCVGIWQHPCTVIDRMRRGMPVIGPGDGTSLWVLTWNGDFARGPHGLLGREDALGQAFHITLDEVITWDQIYRLAGQAIGIEPEIHHVPSDLIAAFDPDAVGSLVGDKANSAVFDNSKIKEFVPDFVATVTWSEGMRRALAWHQAHRGFCAVDREADELWETTTTANRRAVA